MPVYSGQIASNHPGGIRLMSRSRAGEHGEKTNQTLHTERVGLIKTFHTGGETASERARERGRERDVDARAHER